MTRRKLTLEVEQKPLFVQLSPHKHTHHYHHHHHFEVDTVLLKENV